MKRLIIEITGDLLEPGNHHRIAAEAEKYSDMIIDSLLEVSPNLKLSRSVKITSVKARVPK